MPFRTLLCSTLFSLLVTLPLSGQTAHLIALEVGLADYAPFVDVGTSLVVWIDTPESFVRLDAIPEWQLTTEEDDGDLVAASERAKAAYDAETARLARRGRHRFSSEMQQAIRTGDGRPARDTTGFVFEIETIAPPPAGSRGLRLRGPLSYVVATTDTTEISVVVRNLHALAQGKEAITHEGIAIRPYLTGASYGDRQEYKIEMDGYHPVAFAVADGAFEKGLFVEKDVATTDVPLRIRVVTTQQRRLPVDLVFGIGL